VRWGDKVYSPIVDKGEADFIVSFELLEAARYLEYLRPDGQIVTSTQQIDPMPVITGAAVYPEKIAEKIAACADLITVDALALAKEAGNIKAVNVVLIGVMAKASDIAYEKWVETLKTTVPAKFLEINLKAFDLGYNL
jgi:indolepyruvate ferredoxin oxidoreductase beta subunit